jgi:predicted RNase H-like nuclease (RuvC/YqgF family)
MRSALKHLELEKNVEIRQFENRILKLKKEVANKDMEIEQASKKISGES